MREVINIHIGQGGIQTAHAMWELFCIEHGIDRRGQRKIDEEGDDFTFESFFELTPKRQYVPRAVFVDLDPSVIDEVRMGSYRALFHPDRLVSGTEDSANNYARGRHTVGRTKLKECENQLRKVVEGCDYMQGFMLTQSSGGGTGSGYGSMLLERISDQYGKIPKIQPTIIPSSRLSSAVVEPYNSVLGIHTTMEHVDMTLPYDNEALYNIIKSNVGIQSPSFHHINRLIALALSSLTLSLRFEGILHSDMSQMLTNLIPYPRIHFPIMSHGPVLSNERAERTTLNEMVVTKMLFHPENQMISSCNPMEGKYMACALNYRGQIGVSQVNRAIANIKKTEDIQWVDWCPTGFKCGFNNAKPVTIPNSSFAQTSMSVTMVANHSCIRKPFQGLANKFALLFSKRGFVHHYVGEGMEEAELSEGLDDMRLLIQDYMDISTGTSYEDEVSAKEEISQPKEESAVEELGSHQEYEYHGEIQDPEMNDEYEYNGEIAVDNEEYNPGEIPNDEIPNDEAPNDEVPNDEQF